MAHAGGDVQGEGMRYVSLLLHDIARDATVSGSMKLVLTHDNLMITLTHSRRSCRDGSNKWKFQDPGRGGGEEGNPSTMKALIKLKQGQNGMD